MAALDLDAVHPWLSSFSMRTLPSWTGRVKLGQPQPASNWSAEENKGAPATDATEDASGPGFQYAPLKGVPCPFAGDAELLRREDLLQSASRFGFGRGPLCRPLLSLLVLLGRQNS